jgi:photosystem II stability/assembly factor-like uncharacterized protein
MRALLLGSLLVLGASTAFAEAPPGRYQIVASPGAAPGAPTAFLVDTATGQTWAAVKESGKEIPAWVDMNFRRGGKTTPP